MNIVILGCGLSGMLTALSLSKLGISTTILEVSSVNEEKFFYDIRTTALTPESKHFLETIDIWKSVNIVASPILDIYVLDNKSPSMLQFSNDMVNREALGYIVKNSEFKQILFKEVSNNKLITIIDKCNDYNIDSLESHSNIYLADGRSIECSLLILCNGVKTKIHSTYFLPKILKEYQQHAITFYTTHEKHHEGTAVEHFLPTGPFAILPLKNQNCSSIVWTVPKDYSILLQKLPISEFEYLVQRNFGNFLGKIKINSEVVSFPLRAYLTRKYNHNRIVLVADSAHIIHPLAGQGLNQGIKDIQTLVNLISANDINLQMLKKYSQLRYTDNLMMYLITDNINRIFSNNTQLLKNFRQGALQIAEKIPLIKKILLKYAMGDRWCLNSSVKTKK